MSRHVVEGPEASSWDWFVTTSPGSFPLPPAPGTATPPTGREADRGEADGLPDL
jgi:hypothetical protein